MSGLLERDALAGLLVDEIRFHQRAGRARLHALAASDAGRGAHIGVEVEHDLRTMAAVGHADDVVVLYLAASAHAQAAVDAGVEVHGDGRVRVVGLGLVGLSDSGSSA